MGVSATVCDQDKKIKSYPRLMIGNHTGTIVLATKDDGSTKFSGTVIYAGEGTMSSLGRTCDTWELSAFTPFYGTVTLKGE